MADLRSFLGPIDCSAHAFVVLHEHRSSKLSFRVKLHVHLLVVVVVVEDYLFIRILPRFGKPDSRLFL